MGEISTSTKDASAGSALFACVRSRIPDLAIAVAKDFSPRVQRHGSGCVVFDVGGLGRLLGDVQSIGAELARACAARRAGRVPSWSGSSEEFRDLQHASVAVAPTQMAALLLSLAYPSLTVVTHDVASALAPVPLRVLRQLFAELHGATVLRKRTNAHTRHKASDDSFEQAFAILERWGLTTLGELAALPAGDLSARLGQEGVALQKCAGGRDLRPLVPDSDSQRFVERLALEWPIDGLEPLSFVLARLLEPLSAVLERADRAAAAIRLDLRLVDRTMHTRVLQLPTAMRDARVLRTLLLLDLESHPPSAAIDIVAVEIDPAPGRVVQYSLLERARPSAETLATLTARLSALVGESRTGAAFVIDSHQPDAFVMRRFAPDDANPQSAVGNQSAIRNGQAAIGSRQGTVMLRRFRPPIAVRVGVERGRPVRVAIDRRGMPGGQVEQCAGPWRSSGAWWDRAARQWNRDEWDVALSDGSVCRLFRECESGKWFMDGVVD